LAGVKRLGVVALVNQNCANRAESNPTAKEAIKQIDEWDGRNDGSGRAGDAGGEKE
jgi:hypothetical protein